MRTAWWVGSLLLVSATAVADDKADVEKFVRSQFAALDSAHDLDGTFTASPLRSETMHRPDMNPGGGEKTIFFKIISDVMTTKVDTVQVVPAGKGIAWFHAVGSFTLRKGKRSETRVVRINGIAKKDGEWHADAALISVTVSDAALIAGAKHAKPVVVPKQPALDGDKPLATVVTGWIANGGLAKATSSATTGVASGTSPTEHKTGAAAGALAASWDKLKLVPLTAEARLVKPDLGYVFATVAMPVPKTKTHVEMYFSAVVAKEKDGWRWISINWGAPVWTPHDDFVGAYDQPD